IRSRIEMKKVIVFLATVGVVIQVGILAKLTHMAVVPQATAQVVPLTNKPQNASVAKPRTAEELYPQNKPGSRPTPVAKPQINVGNITIKSRMIVSCSTYELNNVLSPAQKVQAAYHGVPSPNPGDECEFTKPGDYLVKEMKAPLVSTDGT